ncbi:hypothetical protein ENSA5_11980 [Enhygromyxa salina]|uniref:Uncharacterized protein n=1 Tax=Enhygromyxa salina TaxID=215803 RepID=A0A2S9YFH0_9BACT|nr:hypothetical protein [Enhygromyxa salina]PRQ03829.1 hypothetical protein ENSA5_11980 [Enhygromyxa salina]
MNKQIQTLIASGACVCVALMFPRPGLAAAPTAEPQARTVKLEIDVEELGDKGIGLDQTIREQLGPRIAQAEFEIVEGGDAAVTLELRFRELPSGEYDYGIHFEFIDGDRREAAIEWVDCHMCVDARLLPVLNEHTPALLAALVAEVAQFEAVEPVEVLRPERGADETLGAGDRGEPREPRRITGLGVSGSIIAGLGVGALIGAGIELGRGVIVEPSARELRETTDHLSPGYALLGVGGSALVAGVTMLAVDLGRQAKKRRQGRVQEAGVYPVFSRAGVGLGVTGKF